MKTRKVGSWYEITIPKEWSTYTIDDLLRNVWKAPKKMIHQFRMENKVKINGLSVNWNQLLIPGQTLQLELFSSQDNEVVPAFYDIPVLYEDDHLMIFNKPAGMDTHPNEPHQSNTLLNAAAFHLQANGELLQPRHIHRLDRDTTGAVLFAKTAFAGSLLDRLLEERKIKRTYLAITDGIFSKNKGTINQPIGRDRHHAVRRRISPTGQTAITHYEVLRRQQKEQQTLVRCQLDTGRTHQIRVHLSSIGHPLAGDVLYNGSHSFPRQALHAVKMELVHPFTNEKIVCHAPFIDQPMIFKNIDPYSI
ncbi:RluA family pseudouridine synthase [Mesobacillus maritimus]|uniref:RluA family pseudouridine synthase n=1 Tax=Mesobacillus maritimus TaxID=1643336 RepID=UPI00203DFB17|nr:RluA family pseudouridine synthase [Mesobacillus maritimus]MCM3586021.1 RluA family pseudouridine synthase [Mesobacillus maritimus]